MNFPNFVAEVSSNHGCDLQRCRQFIQTAAEIGCSAVKFQLFKINKLFAPEILARSEQHRKRKQWELPIEFLPELSTYAHELGLEFGCTPFYLQAVQELEPYVDFYKIASYELLWKEIFEACSKTGKKLIFSSGMATLAEIQTTLKILKSGNSKNITVLHCISGYPTPIKDANLKCIETLRRNLTSKSLQLKFGWSDHTVSDAVIYRAVHAYNASTIEFHLDIDGKGAEFSSGHCWLPKNIKRVIYHCQQGLCADGDGNKQPTTCEITDRDWRADPSDGLRPLKKIRENFNV